jgi:hypothetical protein
MTNQSKLFKPVIILGAPRSGTSVLGRILESHPDFVHIKEPRLTWKFGNDGKSDLLKAVDARPEVKKHIIQKFESFIERPGQRLLEKTPSNSLRVDFIKEIFPDAKFVHIIRNGYDSVLSIRNYWNGFTGGLSYNRIGSKSSILKDRIQEIHWRQIPYYVGELTGRIASKVGFPSTVLWGPRLPAMKGMMSQMDLLEVCALQWRFCVELACQDGRKLPTSNYYEIKLEELNSENLQEIIDFLELKDSGSIMDHYQKNFQAGKSNKRRKDGSEEDMEIIRRYIEPTMQWLDYK